MGKFDGSFDLLRIDLIFSETECDIFGDGAFAEKDALGDEANLVLPSPFVSAGNRDIVQCELAMLWVDEAEDEVDGGGFARAGGTDEADCGVEGNGEAYAVKGWFGGVRVGEADVFQV